MTKTSIVLELQTDALNSAIKLSDLLRKSLLVSYKLDLQDFRDWIEQELNGYKATDNIPDYRQLAGEVRCWNPYRGWMPLIFEDPEESKRLSKRMCSQSIPELEHLLEKPTNESLLHMPFPPEMGSQLSEAVEYETKFSLFVQKVSIKGIIETVRTIVLNWGLNLEKEGILGEGLSFSSKEKEAAKQSPKNTANFFGPVYNPHLQQGRNGIVQVDQKISPIEEFISLLGKELESIGLSVETKTKVEGEIEIIKAQINSKEPKHLIIKEGLKSIRKILESAAGGAVAHLLLELGKIIL